MQWLTQWNEALDYLEQHLDSEIDLDRAAQIAACSSFHFQRMFAYLAGITLTEYIRRRRMTLAAFELASGKEKVIDLAAKYGYDSPTAFNRAFRSVHGVPPSAARAEGIELTAFPRLTFTVSVKGERAMNYRIEKKGPIQIVGVSTKEPMTMEDCFEKVPQFWSKVYEQGWIERLCPLMDGSEPQGILGVSACDGGSFSGYYVAVATNRPAPEGLDSYTVPAGTWAIFECCGPVPDAMQAMQQRIVSEWLPTSGYQYASAPDIEVYPAGDQKSPGYHSQIWLPIVKK